MMESLRWFVLAVVLLVAGASIYYRYENTRPCAHPIAYSLGAIDPRFGVSNAKLESDINTAAQIWDKAAGKQLFVYDPKGDLKINLVYDKREASAELGAEIATAQAETETERASIEAERATLTPDQEDSFNARVSAFNATIAATNAQVARYNQTAGHTFEEGEYVKDSSGRRINIFEFVGDMQLERVLAHELGHAVGLDHNDNPDSIMYAENESGNLVPTKDDLAALKALCRASS